MCHIAWYMSVHACQLSLVMISKDPDVKFKLGAMFKFEQLLVRFNTLIHINF
ncbi:hypothetical protein SOVF_161700 [Spinacia oleracea]|nr:hypothetical protein SOVF_161700 [Spinacia oleracea]